MKIKVAHTGPLGVNTYVAWDEETKKGFIVDLGGFNDTIAGAIKEDDIEIEYIILTHGHCDHIMGVPDAVEALGCKVVAAKDELPMLSDRKLNMSTDFGKTTEITPDILVEEGDTLKVGNIELKFIMTPGHSVGGMCILVDDICFSGDTLFQGSVGRTDFVGGDQATLVKSIREKLFTLDDNTYVLPGHMGTTTIAFEKENNPFV